MPSLSSPTRLRLRYGPSMPMRLGLGMTAHFAAARAPEARLFLDEPLAIAPELGDTLSRADFAGVVDSASGWLYGLGVRPGARVAIVKRNGFDVIALTCAAARIGALPVLLVPTLASRDLASLLQAAGLELLVTDRQTWSERLQGHVPDGIPVLSVEGEIPGSIALDDLRGAPVPAPWRGDPSEPAVVTHTSGTTGVPKLLAHSALSINGQARMQMPLGWLLLRRNSVVGACLHWAHARSIALWIAIGHIRSPLLAMSRMDGASVARAVSRHSPTYLEAQPHSFLGWEELASRADRPFASVRVFMSTFDAAHPRTIRAMLGGSKRVFPVYIQVYAQSETGGISVRITTRFDAHRQRGRNLGGPIMPFTRIRVVDPVTRKRVPAGTAGEVEAITPGICAGYLDDEERTRAARSGRWWRTGDIGSLDRLGQLELLDRGVDAIDGVPSVLGIEDVLLDRLPRCEDVVVVGDEAGRPVPFLCLRDGDELDFDEWTRAIEGIAGLGNPVTVASSSVPRTATGKVRRAELRALTTAPMP